jgi:hypothetical protein
MIPKKHATMIPSMPNAVGCGAGSFAMFFLPQMPQKVFPRPLTHRAVVYFFSACSIPASTSGAITA